MSEYEALRRDRDRLQRMSEDNLKSSHLSEIRSNQMVEELDERLKEERRKAYYEGIRAEAARVASSQPSASTAPAAFGTGSAPKRSLSPGSGVRAIMATAVSKVTEIVRGCQRPRPVEAATMVMQQPVQTKLQGNLLSFNREPASTPFTQVNNNPFSGLPVPVNGNPGGSLIPSWPTEPIYNFPGTVYHAGGYHTHGELHGAIPPIWYSSSIFCKLWITRCFVRQ